MPKLADSSGPPTVIFLGAGFSRVTGVPLAGELFDEEPVVDRITRQRLVDSVRSRWVAWHERTGGAPEEHLAELETYGGATWREATWYVGLVIALRMGHLREI